MRIKERSITSVQYGRILNAHVMRKYSSKNINGSIKIYIRDKSAHNLLAGGALLLPDYVDFMAWGSVDRNRFAV